MKINPSLIYEFGVSTFDFQNVEFVNVLNFFKNYSKKTIISFRINLIKYVVMENDTIFHIFKTSCQVSFNSNH